MKIKEISNHALRCLWLDSNGLLNIKSQKLDVLDIIKKLGFVQLDSIQNVSRAHHHILWSRNVNYKEDMLDTLLLKKGNIFEHFTHDASVLPIEFFSFWQGHYQHMKQKLDKSKYYKDILDEQGMKDILNRFKNEGVLHSTDFTSSIHKTTLDYMWYCGVLSTAYRNKFRKYYDVIENIIPPSVLNHEVSQDERIDWLCSQALHRMSVATAKEIKNFWDTLTREEVTTWIKNNTENLVEVRWQDNEGKYIKSYAPLDIEKRLATLKESRDKIQIINPFDPAIRDRVRLKKIFNFEYKIEIFVPKEKRIWGYYVYPLLQGSTFLGRIELKADRKMKQLNVLNFWREDGVVWDEKLQEKLDLELLSFALLAGIKNVCWFV